MKSSFLFSYFWAMIAFVFAFLHVVWGEIDRAIMLFAISALYDISGTVARWVYERGRDERRD